MTDGDSTEFRRIVCHTLGTDFRACTSIITEPIPKTLEKTQVLVENHYLGINASDINLTNGQYFPGVAPPFDCGFESVGKISAVGSEVKNFKIGDSVIAAGYGAFAECKVMDQSLVIPIPTVNKAALAINVCGVTASIALEQVGQLTHGETVLITAAAGGTGQFAVQLAKLAGNHVIGTCSSASKVAYLKSIGCDRAVNYNEEDLDTVLTKEYPKGVNLVFESVGGAMFNTCVKHLANRGRVVVIGAISGYADGSAWNENKDNTDTSVQPLPSLLLKKSASVRGFLLLHFIKMIGPHMKKLFTLMASGVLKAGVDPTVFTGLEGVPEAIDHMFQRLNVGKVTVELKASSSSSA